ncbi:MAG: S8 family serine peptidase [Candidatus Zixiibacteriota bacterium]
MKTGTSRLAIVASSILAITVGLTHSLAAGSPKLAPALNVVIDNPTSPDSIVTVVIFLESESRSNALSAIAASPNQTRATRIKTVISSLSSASPSSSDSRVMHFLDINAVGQTRRFWIAPAIETSLPVAKLADLAALPGIRLVIPNVTLDFDAPVDIKAAPAISTSVSSELTLLKVPELWRLGIRGNGRLVCSFDTGVESTHPALASKWRGTHADLRASWFSKVAPDTIPYDKAGHGTHTMGIMVGSTASDSFGVAPGAEWITAGVIDQGRPLNVTIGDIIEAFQWALNPDGDTATTDDVPDVILNSWGIPTGLFEPCDETFAQVIDNVEAAGIVTIFACGNEGPNPKTVRSPADRSSSPVNSFSVGAIDISKVVATFSSRGPSSCDSTQLKPELVAPGVAIRSSTRGGTYAYMSGTSMAAPFIAGLVLLCREYNPDATVDQIKYALLQAADDLGPAGDDNAYGHGLVDATRLLALLPQPGQTRFTLLGRLISGDGVASPGEAIELQLMVAETAGNVSKVNGTLGVQSTGQITITKGTAQFLFGSGGSTALNTDPFRLTLDSSLVNGASIPMIVTFADSNGVLLDSLTFDLTAGFPAPGHVAPLTTGTVDFSVSDFAQYGLAPGSIYNLEGQGFRVNGSANLLYEAGIIVGRNSLQLAGSVRDSLGCYGPSAFAPVESLTQYIDPVDGGVHTSCQFADSRAKIAIPITVSQESMHYGTADESGYVILKYHLVNRTLQTMTEMHFGFLADFDISGQSDQVQLNSSLGMIYQYSDIGPMVGIVALSEGATFTALSNSAGKVGLKSQEKYDLIASAVNSVDASVIGDRMIAVSFGPYTIPVGDSVEIAIALVGGMAVNELVTAAVRAEQRMGIPTAVDDDANVPESFSLHQNYPNPFNPSTTISFALPKASDIRLEVFNLLGERVRTLVSGSLAAGEHHIVWMGENDGGQSVASGVYFYRLTGALGEQTRKMMLVK